MSKLNQFIYKNDDRKVYYLAEREYDDYGGVRKQIWHREDGPARIEYHKDGRIHYEVYCINDKEHREDGPASIFYNDDGSIKHEAYYINGKRHREDGPAYIEYYKDGGIEYEEYWLDYKNYTKERYNRELRKRNTKIGSELYD